MQSWGIVDQDQLSAEKKSALEAMGIFALSVYSIEGLYYDPAIVSKIAERQSSIIEKDARAMVEDARTGFLAEIARNVERLSARMTEQVVKDKISCEMPDWKKIQSSQGVHISVDSKALYDSEIQQLNSWIASSDVEKIVARYPIRETGALTAIATALQFKNRTQYESAVRKLVVDDKAIRSFLETKFGGLLAAINRGRLGLPS